MGSEAELMELVHGVALWALVACGAAVLIGAAGWVTATVRATRADTEQRRGKRWDR